MWHWFGMDWGRNWGPKKTTTHWRDEEIQELISAFAFGAGGNPISIRVNCPDTKVNLHQILLLETWKLALVSSQAGHEETLLCCEGGQRAQRAPCRARCPMGAPCSGGFWEPLSSWLAPKWLGTWTRCLLQIPSNWAVLRPKNSL